QALHFEPEVRVLHAGDVGDEAAFLQIAARQRAVEIIDDGGAERPGFAGGCVGHSTGLGRVGGTVKCFGDARENALTRRRWRPTIRAMQPHFPETWVCWDLPGIREARRTYGPIPLKDLPSLDPPNDLSWLTPVDLRVIAKSDE